MALMKVRTTEPLTMDERSSMTKIVSITVTANDALYDDDEMEELFYRTLFDRLCKEKLDGINVEFEYE